MKRRRCGSERNDELELGNSRVGGKGVGKLRTCDGREEKGDESEEDVGGRHDAGG